MPVKKSGKLFFKVVKIFFALLIILGVGVFAYVSVNKKSIIAQVTSEIETKLNGKLSVGKVELSFIRNFPSVSVLLHNVTLTDTQFLRHKHTFFKAEEVFVSLAITKLIRKQPPLRGLRIDDGEIYLYTDTAGYTNTYLLKGKKDSTKATTSGSNTELKKIVLNKVRIIVDDGRKQKLHDLVIKNLKVDVDDDDNATRFSSKAEILIKSLAFNTNKGTYLKDKVFAGNFKMQINKSSHKLLFDSIRVKIGGHSFSLSGNFDLAGNAPQFNLRVYSRNIEYPFLRSLVTEKISKSLSIVDLDKTLDVSASITGPIKGGEPLVYATWIAKNTQLKTPFLDFEKASFSGFFTNEVVPGFPRYDPNSKIEINQFTASWHDLPLVSNRIEIMNLSFPELTCDLSTNFELKKLNELIGSNSLQLREGTGTVRLNYKGPIVRNNNTNSFLNGEVTFKNGNILYASRDVEMKNVQAKMVFRNSDVFVENLQTSVFGQNIIMQGQAKNLLTLINTEPDKANIDWNIFSPSLNLEAFTYLLSPRKKGNSTQGNKGVKATTAKIDNLLEQGRLHVVLKANNLIYKNFKAHNAIADITLLQDRYLINKVSMNHAGGNMGLSGSLLNLGALHEANLLVNMDNVDVSNTLKAFDNFGQDGITSENLEGKLTTKIVATLKLDTKGKVIPASIVSTVDFSLKEGALNNYEPIKKLQRFVFKNRDFDNIRFAELKDRLEIKDREIKINRMEIQSSVMTLYVEGIYSQKGGTDMSIQVPLSNMKKRGLDYNPENLGADKKGGGSIYIRGRPGPDGNVKFKLDLFNRFDKDKAKGKK